MSEPGLYELSVQRRAVAIMRGLVIICANAVGPYKVQAIKALVPYLKPWLEQFCNILHRPYSPTVLLASLRSYGRTCMTTEQ